MLIILACFSGKEKRKKFDSGISGSGSSSRKSSALNQVFFYKRDIKLDDLFNPFEFEHAKSIILYFFPHAYPPAAYWCFQHEVGHSRQNQQQTAPTSYKNCPLC